MVKGCRSLGLRFFVVLLFIGSQGVRLDAQTQVTIRASKDNTLYQDVNGVLSNGAGQHFFVGKTSSNLIRRALVAFNVAGRIPAGSQILSATLTLNMSQTSSGPDTVKLYRTLQDWGEGTSVAAGNEGGGAPATMGDATWIHKFFNTLLWSNAGGDFLATPRATQTVSTIGSYTWGSTSEMASDVQRWLDNPSTNFGWIFLGEETASHLTKRFDTKEVPDSTARPKLIVTYMPQVGVEESHDVPNEFALHQNYPNPFNPTTTIEYALPAKAHITLRVFNLLGQEVATLVDEVQEAGNKSVTFSSSGLVSGMYFYRFSSESFSQTRKLVILK
jgi:hypothetical protein